jgi:hypothetical protein
MAECAESAAKDVTSSLEPSDFEILLCIAKRIRDSDIHYTARNMWTLAHVFPLPKVIHNVLPLPKVIHNVLIIKSHQNSKSSVERRNPAQKKGNLPYRREEHQNHAQDKTPTTFFNVLSTTQP